MFFWYLALGAAAVWLVFGDPAIDFRMVFIGAILPDVVAYTTGSPLSHSVLSLMVLLAIVMLVTMRSRKLRRSLIFVVIGAFLHLAFDGSWATKELFWYPLFGTESLTVPPAQTVASAVIKEVIGVGLLLYMANKVGITSKAALIKFFRTGRVDFERKSAFFAQPPRKQC